ncbi:MAG: hypothetical protein Q4E33_05355 [Erysipelotrichaceae bacterium]|nr:hypothetical protein [Erysipelotrichaceae bacterium]
MKNTLEIKEDELEKITGGEQATPFYRVKEGDFVTSGIIKDQISMFVECYAYRIDKIEDNIASLLQYKLMNNGEVVISNYPKKYEAHNFTKVDKPKWVTD